jgi:hypothetical protein
MSKELVTKPHAPPPAIYDDGGADALRSDMVIPYVVITQSMSEAFTQKKAEVGDIIRSNTFEKVGDPQTPIHVIFLHYPKPEWVIQKLPKNQNRFEFVRTEPRTAANDTLPWEWWADDEGVEMGEGAKGALKWKRVKSLRVFAILNEDIAAAQAEMAKVAAGELPDPNKALSPVVISFRVTSFAAGKDVCTFINKAKSMGVAPFRYMVPMHAQIQSNDQGTFYVWKVDQIKAKGVAKEDLALVENWARVVSSGVQLQTDEGAMTENVREAVSDESRGDVC